MQELMKLWKEYESSKPDKSGDFASNGPTLEVQIPAEYVTATNCRVRPRYIQRLSHNLFYCILRPLAYVYAGKRWPAMGNRYIHR